MPATLESKFLTLDRFGYKWKGERFQRVTTIKSKKGTGSALVDWAARTVAAEARRIVIEHRQGRLSLDEALVALASDDLARAHDTARDAAADFGSVFHSLVENIARGDGDALHVAEAEIERYCAEAMFTAMEKRRPADGAELRIFVQSMPEGLADAVAKAKDRLWPDVEAFLEWNDRAKPVWGATEFNVLNRTFGYMGTADAIVKIGGSKVLMDLKTSKDVYSDYAIQLAAYRYAEKVVNPATGEEKDMCEVDTTGVLHVRDGRCVLYDVPAGPREFEAFKACHALYWFDRNTAKEFEVLAG